MNDMYEKGYQDGYKNGCNDGFAKGWHEAMRTKPQPNASTLDQCPKCNVTLNKRVGYVCQSWGCPMKLSGEIKSIYGET